MKLVKLPHYDLVRQTSIKSVQYSWYTGTDNLQIYLTIKFDWSYRIGLTEYKFTYLNDAFEIAQDII